MANNGLKGDNLSALLPETDEKDRPVSHFLPSYSEHSSFLIPPFLPSYSGSSFNFPMDVPDAQ